MENNQSIKNVVLGEKYVADIKGEFFVPSYQRGYRWEKVQTEALLNDIYYNGAQPYCLQPIVVRHRSDGRLELIDGQQRLTTIYIIYKYIQNVFPDHVKPNFTIDYETRKETATFFDRMDDEQLASKNIDFFFINKAHQTVAEWFRQRDIFVVSDFVKYLKEYVRVIWYELPEGNESDSIGLFTRLNIGRIPLTNAELVKALFLCRNDHVNYDKQMEIALQWDRMERDLHNENLWYFLTRRSPEDYPTRIELIFDFMAGKDQNERDSFFTFTWFSRQRDNLLSLWNDIVTYFFRLKEWFYNDDIYHHVGYLVAVGHCSIPQLKSATENMRKSEIKDYLTQQIRESVDSHDDYRDLQYTKPNQKQLMSNILLLFNVVSLIRNGHGSRFPFREWNTKTWSLEHIHAQQSEGLNTVEKWHEWLSEHLDSVLSIKGECELTTEMRDAIEKDISGPQFNQLSVKVTNALSEGSDTDYIHTLSNMALLNCGDNSVLSNSLFDVKRSKIVEMDKQGRFIPYCTKMVFMKYYTTDSNVSYHFWGETDRKAYINEIYNTLKPYLKEQ
ncbi:MAG: DUF262 domain-containing protein [Bacteroidales bacterium]|nr:DUF262 domain-containing protein [Bacteroidales bacterium]